MSKKWILNIIRDKVKIEKELKEKSIELFRMERHKENWKRMYNNCLDHNLRLLQYNDLLLKDNSRLYDELYNKGINNV